MSKRARRTEGDHADGDAETIKQGDRYRPHNDPHILHEQTCDDENDHPPTKKRKGHTMRVADQTVQVEPMKVRKEGNEEGAALADRNLRISS